MGPAMVTPMSHEQAVYTYIEYNVWNAVATGPRSRVVPASVATKEVQIWSHILQLCLNLILRNLSTGRSRIKPTKGDFKSFVRLGWSRQSVVSVVC